MDNHVGKCADVRTAACSSLLINAISYAQQQLPKSSKTMKNRTIYVESRMCMCAGGGGRMVGERGGGVSSEKHFITFYFVGRNMCLIVLSSC